MYVASKGGEKAIAAAHALLAEKRRGDRGVAALTIPQIREQMALSVARVMAEGSLYDRDLAALAIKQAWGDLIEAIFLLRAYRTTLPRFGYAVPLDTGAMRVSRRVSATFKDLPGGQILGPTFDYTHRLIDFALAAETEAETEAQTGAEVGAEVGAETGAETGAASAAAAPDEPPPKVLGLLDRDGLIEPPDTGASDSGAGRDGAPDGDAPPDMTREPLSLPASRALRLQALARADEGFLLGLAYSTQRGFGRTHAFVGELRIGIAVVEMEIPELGLTVAVGEIEITECETVNQFKGSKTEPPQFTRGYGLAFGRSERKTLAMSLVDRALRRGELGEDGTGAPAEDEEFVLSHSDNIQASGFLEHIKLPHYVDFQSELELVRALRAEAAAGGDPEPDRATEAAE